MSGTEDAWPLRGARGAHPAPVATVCLRAASVHVASDDDGDPVLIVCDGETAVELSSGLGGNPASAARGARRIAEALLEFASTIDAGMARSRSGGS